MNLDHHHSFDGDGLPSVDERLATANLFGFLGRLWIKELDSNLLQALQSEAIRAPYEQLGGHIPSGEPVPITEELKIDFCGCFLGPNHHLPPYQSVVKHSHFQGDCVESLRSYIEIIGIPEDDFFSEPSMIDHAGIQLAMMNRLCLAELRCADALRRQFLELRFAFFSDHLLWLQDYCQIAHKRTTSRFYQGLFKVTQRFLELENTTINRQMEKIDQLD